MSWVIELTGRLGSFDLDLSCTLEDSLFSVIGPNGSGKTTLLRSIVGADLPLVGRIVVNGRTLFDTDQSVRVEPHERRIGYVPQGYALFPHMTVGKNVAFGHNAAPGLSVEDILRRFDLLRFQDRFPEELSGGERQRVALARAIATQPDALLLDEPLAALDPRVRRALRTELVRMLKAEGLPAIFVTHDVRDVRAFGGTVVVVEDGRVVQTGTVEDLQSAPASPFVAEFLDA